MQNLRALRQRIRSVQNTQKITRAMQMVSGAKLKRAQDELLGFRPYQAALAAMLDRFLAAHPDLTHPLLELSNSSFSRKRESDPRFRGDDERTTSPPVGLIVLTSDTGLCGTYNDRVIQAAEGFLIEHKSVTVVTIGKKGSRFFHRHGVPVSKEINDWSGRYDPAKAADLTGGLKRNYLEGKVSAWWVATTEFVSALRFKAVVERFLPIERPSPAAREGKGEGFPERIIVEPDLKRLAEGLLPRFVQAQFSRVLLTAFTSEHSARMIAMKNATDNAMEMIDHLTLVRNKVRQAAITKELLEVVSGAEALK